MNRCELIVRQAFRFAAILPGTSVREQTHPRGKPAVLSLPGHRSSASDFTGMKCFLCDAEIAFFEDSQLALDLPKVPRLLGSNLQWPRSIVLLAASQVPQHLVIEGEILQRPAVLRIQTR